MVGEFFCLDPEFCIAGETGRSGGSGENEGVKTLGTFLTDWLAFKVIMIITEGCVRNEGQKSTCTSFYCPGWPRL